jgi:FG-GAP-like repeat/IPT/TIG domain
MNYPPLTIPSAVELARSVRIAIERGRKVGTRNFFFSPCELNAVAQRWRVVGLTTFGGHRQHGNRDRRGHAFTGMTCPPRLHQSREITMAISKRICTRRFLGAGLSGLIITVASFTNAAATMSPGCASANANGWSGDIIAGNPPWQASGALDTGDVIIVTAMQFEELVAGSATITGTGIFAGHQMQMSWTGINETWVGFFSGYTSGLGSAGLTGVGVLPHGDMFVTVVCNPADGSLPNVSASTPKSGPVAGGTSVALTGTKFTGATAVNFGIDPATSFTVISDTFIIAVSPSGGSVVDVRVTTSAGTSLPNAFDQFTYGTALPTPLVESLAPNFGPPGAGIFIQGVDFGGEMAVNFGSNSAAFHVIDSRSIIAFPPPGTGTVDVTVTTSGATSATTAADKFSYTITRSHNFDFDGKSDILWSNGSGDLSFWLMNGASVSSTGGVSGVPGIWSIVGQRDFDGDGEADLLWRDTSGNIAMWFMSGAAVGSTAGVGIIPTNWSVVGVADFNGDGLGDILWRDTAGDTAIWLMNGATAASSAGLGAVSGWSVAGTGDFNGDGMADILWRDGSGDTAIWLMNATTVASTGALGAIPTTWSIVGTGDFNGDGKSDIVWRDTSGNTSLWLMNGAVALSAVALGNVPITWSIVQTGDYNGDGMTDLLWRDTGGNTAIWFMNGTAIASTAGVGNIPTTWTVQSVNAE